MIKLYSVPVQQSADYTLVQALLVQTRAANATAQPPPPRSVPAPRPINKRTLYTVRPDDRPFIKRSDDKKRKRTELPKRNSYSNEGSMRPIAAKSTQTTKNTAFTFSAPFSTSQLMTQEQMGELSFIAPRADTTGDGKNGSLNSLPIIEAQVDEGGFNAPHVRKSNNVLVKDSAASTGRNLNYEVTNPHHPNKSPEYELPTSQMRSVDNPWGREDDEGDSPGSQIALRANAEEQPSREDIATSHQSDRLPALKSVEVQRTEEEARAFFLAGSKEQEVPKDTDEDFPDTSANALMDRLALEHPSAPRTPLKPSVQPLTVVRLSPNLPSCIGLECDVEMNDSPFQDAQLEVEDEDGDKISVISTNRPLTCLERRLARGPFVEEVLDAYLEVQRNQDDSDRPTEADLDAQNWGTIDPHVVWPQRMTERERNAKVKQIEARGGRKANFGKIITAQNLQERAESGWEPHQWRNKRDDEQTKELVRRLEELFNVEGLANLVPATRHGRLVMVEREVSDEEPHGPGRRKKKNQSKVYAVHGAPNPN
ncbi:hypothetical protein EG329_012167 [Mollisiaceae sp. DMI_Dod_QoI]|nr:hypothetical protein EG329_012167 [Helotiales sp. DMI_Dod_QoI]